MWLPKFVYESIPFYYLGFGVIGLVAAVFVDYWYWSDVLALGGAAAMVIGVMLLLRRRGYRASRSRVDFESSPYGDD